MFKKGLTTKLHLCYTSAKYEFTFHLSIGNCYDVTEGGKLIETIYSEESHSLMMDRAYEDDKTCALVAKQGGVPVVPPKKNRRKPWEYDKEFYKRRNEVERYF